VKIQNRKAANKLVSMAKTADKHTLYEESVQNPESDIEFLTHVYKKAYRKPPLALREDFCGTAKLCVEWVKSAPERSAVGLDLDEPTLAWATRHNVSTLAENQKRVQLLKRNVLEDIPSKADVIVAFNFSYCIFKERETLLSYFKKAHEGLGENGMFSIDIHGGTETREPVEEETEYESFTYVWDQEPYDPITGNAMRYIHFKFKDGSQIRRAFTYNWRIWDLPEIQDILRDAGFREVDVYWEGATKNGEGTGDFRKTQKAEEEQAWVSYVIAWP